VEPPQRGHEVKNDVLKVDEKIEYDNTGEDVEPKGQGQIVQEAPAFLRCNQGEADRYQGKKDAHDQCIDGHDAEVVKPSHRF